MTGWIVLGVVLLLLFLFLQLRVGLAADYGENGLRIQLRAAWLRISLFPWKAKTKKEKKPEKPKKKKEKAKKPEQKNKTIAQRMDTARSWVREFLPLGLEAAGSFPKKIRVERLHLFLTIPGSEDPVRGAMWYGQAQAFIGSLWGPLNQAFLIEDGHAGIRAGFEREDFELQASLALSIKIGQMAWFGIQFGVRALARFLRLRNQNKAGKAE